MKRHPGPGAGRRRRWSPAGAAAVALGWAVVAGARPALAEGLRRLDAAWLVPERLAAVAAGDTAGGRAQGAWARVGQARLYGLPELPVRRLAVGLAAGRGAWAAEAAWEAAGGGPLRDDVWQGRLQFGRRLRAGVQGRWRRLGPGAGAPWQAQACDVSLGFAAPTGPLGMCVARVHWPVFQVGHRALAPEPATRLLLAVAAPGRAVALTLEAGADGRPAGGWEVLCGLGRGLGLSWRADPASGAMGAGLWWRRGPLRLRTSHLAHPELGLTHRFELGLGAVEASPW